jgi:hypothetical protein
VTVALTPSALQVGGSQEVRNGVFYCAHVYKLDMPPERVLAAIQGDWNLWWSMGTRQNVHVDDKGVTHWKFIPLKGGGTMVWFNIAMQPPAVENGASGKPEKIVLAMEFDGACFGPGRYEIFAAPDGGTFLRGSWDGVTPRGWRRFAPGMFGFMHLLVEGRAVAHLNRLRA